jgi:predicted AAA+ superfamily ATPase
MRAQTEHPSPREAESENMDETLSALARDAGRLIDRLLHLVPAVEHVDWHVARAAAWTDTGMGHALRAHADLDDVQLDDLHHVDDQKAAIELNTRQFLAGLPANNVLLWGARGTGKSSLVHALLNRYADQGLRLVEVGKTDLAGLPGIAGALRALPYRFVVFCDDLSFEADDAGYKALKSALEGSVFKAAGNVLIYATSNRRHLLPEYNADNAASHLVDGELHHGEAVEEKISLSDRFGLWLSFYPFPQQAYLDIARHWVAVLAARHGLALAWSDAARAEALRFALARGVRSGRTAQHFARHWVGSHGLDARA